MEEQNFIKKIGLLYGITMSLLVIVFILFGGVLYINFDPELSAIRSVNQSESKVNPPEIVDGKHVITGLLDGEGLEVVISNCTACHSAMLITQNRATKAGWLSMIRWMQSTQNLWDLGENEAVILNYLSTNYAPQKKGRRTNLTNIEWYELEP
jgi:hypothetical protein